MSEWELEFSVLLLLGLWACEVLQVSEKIFRSRFKSGTKGHDCPLDSPDAAIRADGDPSQPDLLTNHLDSSAAPLDAGGK
jgi:hypothetical protein